MPPAKAAGATKKASSKPTGDAARIVTLKDKDGKTWAEISDIMGMAQGKCMFLYEQAIVTPETRITGRTEDELKKKIAKERQNGVSWGVLAARSGKSEGYCKKAFQEVTGEEPLGHRIGKGGRYPSGRAPAKAKGATKKAAKKVSSAVKKAAKQAPAKAVKATKKTAKKAAKKTVKASA